MRHAMWAAQVRRRGHPQQGEEREEFLASLDTEEKIKQARRDGKLSYSGAINELMKLGYSHSEAMSIFNRG